MCEVRLMELTKKDYDLIQGLVIKELENRHIIYFPDWEELSIKKKADNDENRNG